MRARLAARRDALGGVVNDLTRVIMPANISLGLSIAFED